MLNNPIQIEFEAENVVAEETLKEADAEMIRRVEEEVGDWPTEASADMTKALRVVGLYLEENQVWHSSNDILATRILDALVSSMCSSPTNFVHTEMAYINIYQAIGVC